MVLRNGLEHFEFLLRGGKTTDYFHTLLSWDGSLNDLNAWDNYIYILYIKPIRTHSLSETRRMSTQQYSPT